MDPATFAALVAKNRVRVEAVLSRMLPADEVEDVVQETLLRAYVGLSQLRELDRFGAWLCGIAINLAKMRLRARAARPRVVAGGGSVEAVADDEPELLSLVRDAVAVLPPGQRDVVLLHYVDDLSCEEIARLLGTTPGAVRVRLHRARAQLRRQLVKEAEMVEMKVEDVLVRVSNDDASQVVDERRVVLLKEEGGARVLAIWIGAPEGNALALPRAEWTPPRPLTVDLLIELVRALGGRVERVAVTELREDTFYATVSVAVDGRSEHIDARPSDAINVAVRVGAPILVDEGVLEQQGWSGDDLEAELQRQCDRVDEQLPPGTWTSLSSELLRSIYKRR